MAHFGNIATEGLLRQKSAQYPSHYKTDKTKDYGKRVHDCVGLIKAYLWCDSFNSVPKYNSEQDKDVSGFLANCKETGSIDTIPEIPGVLVFMSGHVGVYIGNGKVIECKGSDGVVITELKKRAWYKWGKLDWIDYVEEKMFEDGEELEALDYLVEQGRITDKDYWIKAISVVYNQKWLIIKWANDVKQLLK